MMYYIILLLMTMIGSCASLCLKKATESDKVYLSLMLYLGGILYFISALMNIYVLKYLDYSIVLPLTSLTYIWTMFLSKMILKEQIKSKKILGMALIIIGIVCIVV